jgi:hypothetical protein
MESLAAVPFTIHMMEVPREENTIADSSPSPVIGPVAIRLDSPADNVTHLFYKHLILRGNRARPLDGGAAWPGTSGIMAQSVDNLTLDDNFVDALPADSSVQRGSANNVQVFNNRTLSGTFLALAIGSTAPILHQAELTTDADLLMATL